MKRFKSARHLQRFVSIHDPIANLYHLSRHSLNASEYRMLRAEAEAVWQDIAAIKLAA
jgi:putative transposase